MSDVAARRSEPMTVEAFLEFCDTLPDIGSERRAATSDIAISFDEYSRWTIARPRGGVTWSHR